MRNANDPLGNFAVSHTLYLFRFAYAERDLSLTRPNRTVEPRHMLRAAFSCLLEAAGGGAELNNIKIRMTWLTPTYLYMNIITNRDSRFQ